MPATAGLLGAPASAPLFGWWTGPSGGVAGAFPHTDPGSPVPNSIYRRIGCRPVEDRVALAFSATSATGR